MRRVSAAGISRASSCRASRSGRGAAAPCRGACGCACTCRSSAAASRGTRSVAFGAVRALQRADADQLRGDGLALVRAAAPAAADPDARAARGPDRDAGELGARAHEAGRRRGSRGTGWMKWSEVCARAAARSPPGLGAGVERALARPGRWSRACRCRLSLDGLRVWDWSGTTGAVGSESADAAWPSDSVAVRRTRSRWLSSAVRTR